MVFETIPAYIQIILFPIIVLGLWTLIFYSRNSYFTKIFIEGGYLLVGIPLMVLTLLSIPMMMVIFWASATDNNEVSFALLSILIGVSIIIEYAYLKRIIKQIEEKEELPILQILKRELRRDTHRVRKEKREVNKQEVTSFYDEITEMNIKASELDRQQKEKIRKALLGDSS
ncbi:MAG: hypothetical protein ACW98K_02200 [Candidatus Kariarchaeaceae archaeon]|jgi:general stress protein CsbA